MKMFAKAALGIAMTLTPVVMTAATAQNYNDRRYNDRRYRGNDRYYRQHCKKSSGTTGAVAGGVGGAVAGNVLGGGVLGTVAGGVGGALLGKHLDKKHDAAQNRRNGC